MAFVEKNGAWSVISYGPSSGTWLGFHSSLGEAQRIARDAVGVDPYQIATVTNSADREFLWAVDSDGCEAGDLSSVMRLVRRPA